MHRLGWSKPRAGCGRWLSVRKDASLMSGCPACPSCTRGRRAMFLKKFFFFSNRRSNFILSVSDILKIDLLFFFIFLCT